MLADQFAFHPSQMREDYYAGLEDRYFLTFDQAKKQRLVINFDVIPPAPAPSKIGVTVIADVKLEDVVPYMDWVSLLSLSLEFCFLVFL
jgi:5-methyltetrahydrofolate--homocysteine methyltransferase